MGGERIMQHQFFLDTHARIPFSVIGIFLILGSSVVSVYITRLEMQKSDDIARSLDSNEIETMLYTAESDMATALNIAGMKALKEIGKIPVIHSTLGPADEINYIRLKKIIQGELNNYLTGHFLYNTYTNGPYAINVILHNENPIQSPELITMNTTTMRLERPTLPFIGPQPAVTHATYLVASVPIDIEIRDISDTPNKVMTTRTLQVSSILTSRYPLLKSLTEEYDQTINGTFSPLWTLTTALSNIYSLIRSYKHYRTGRPENIVDNRHLTVLLNSGLLFEESLVFSSVDPLSIIELARKTKQLLKQQAQDPLVTLNQEMNGTSYDVRTNNLTQGTANVDAGEAPNASIDDRFSLNLSEIAQRILYNITSVTLRFENEEGDIKMEYILFDENATQNIKEAVEYWANQSYVVTQVTKHLQRNDTTYHVLSFIASEVYHDEMDTKVATRSVAAEFIMNPGPGWTDAGAGPWNIMGFLPLSKQEIKPARGHVITGSSLYKETYNVTYHRTHSWFRWEERNISGNITLVQVWDNLTDIQIETVILQEILQDYAGYHGMQNDIVDVMYYNSTLDDPNLEDTLAAYLVLYPDSNPLKQQLIYTQDNQGTIGCTVSVPGSYNLWVLDESWDALTEILGSLTKDTSSLSLNATQYTNPVSLVKKAADDYFSKFLSETDQYLDRSDYQSGFLFYSTGKKTVYASREWFVLLMKAYFESVISCLSDELQAAINAAIPPEMECTAQNLTETLDETVDAVRNQFTIPFGLNMTLSRFDNEGTLLWNETIRLAVDQKPNFLNPFEPTIDSGEELWTMKLRNRCLFGPTGLPILPPTPVTPWLMTLNLWAIDVEGEYAHLKIIDTSDETIFNPLLGHEAQAYIREAKVVTVGNVTLGENTRLSFGFTTISFGLVPPWGMMVGDLQSNWYDEHTPGFDDGE
jgi:hypothetical protein